MREITDMDIEDWIYMMNGGEPLQWAVIMSAVALLLGIVALIKFIVYCVTENKKEKVTKKDAKSLTMVALWITSVCVVSVPILIVALKNTRMSYFTSRSGIAYFIFGAVLLYLVISFITMKPRLMTLFLDAVGASAGVILAVISLASALLFYHYEEEDWYVTTAVIDDLDENTNRNDYVHLTETDERVVIITRCAQDLWRDICDDKKVTVYVVYGEDGEPLVSYDMKENEYVGDRLAAE